MGVTFQRHSKVLIHLAERLQFLEMLVKYSGARDCPERPINRVDVKDINPNRIIDSMEYCVILVKNCGGTWEPRDKKLLKEQMKVGWDIGAKTPRQSCIRPGTKALIYISGAKAMVLVGQATINSPVFEVTKKMQRQICAFPLVMSADYWLTFEDFKLWGKPIAIKGIVDSLSFIKSKKSFGGYFQGGIVQICPKDYTLIIDLSKKINSEREKRRATG